MAVLKIAAYACRAMAEPFLADLDRAVMSALEGGAERVDALLHEVGCAPLELKDTLKSLRRMGLVESVSGRWSLTAPGRRLAP